MAACSFPTGLALRHILTEEPPLAEDALGPPTGFAFNAAAENQPGSPRLARMTRSLANIVFA
jgi:hypothetical protein